MKRLIFISMVLLAGVCAAFVAPAVANMSIPQVTREDSEK